MYSWNGWVKRQFIGFLLLLFPSFLSLVIVSVGRVLGLDILSYFQAILGDQTKLVP